MVRGYGQMYITGPDVVRAVTGEEVSHEDLGGAIAHATRSGVAHFVSDSDQDCLSTVRQLLSYLPQNNMEDPPAVEPGDDPNRIDEGLRSVVPDDPVKAYKEEYHDTNRSRPRDSGQDRSRGTYPQDRRLSCPFEADATNGPPDRARGRLCVLVVARRKLWTPWQHSPACG